MKLKKIWKVFGALFALCLILIVGAIVVYNYEMSPCDKKDNTDIVFVIESGQSSKTVAKNLEDSKLIHNKDFFVLYLKINKINTIKASTYKLKRSMGVKEIIDVIYKGNGYNPDEIEITFKEGKNIRSIANVIASNTNNTYDDVMKKVNDKAYIDSLIEKYWFLDKNIKNTDLYYALEGFLYPDTYRFINKDVTVEEIFSKMLDKEDKVLTKYKNEIEKSNFSIFEIITFASVVELEGSKDQYRANIASTFYNRIKIGMSLGSDVTTCYALKIDDTAKCHREANFNYQSKYNTRLLNLKGLPVGPICNPSESSIKAVLNPSNTEYLYFVADKNTKMYFFKTQEEFAAKIAELKKNGDWL